VQAMHVRVIRPECVSQGAPMWANKTQDALPETLEANGVYSERRIRSTPCVTSASVPLSCSADSANINPMNRPGPLGPWGSVMDRFAALSAASEARVGRSATAS
jgi:hypothetical protein